MRIAGAQARRVLVDAAAAQVGRAGRRAAPPSPAPWCTQPSGRKMSYGEIAAFADAAGDAAGDRRREGPEEPRASTACSARASRASTCRRRPTGAAKYGIDVRVPGMAYATFVRAAGARQRARGGPTPPSAKKMPGITDVVPLDHGVAVVGETYRRGEQGAQAAQGDVARRPARRRASTPTRTSRPISATAAIRSASASSGSRRATREGA